MSKQSDHKSVQPSSRSTAVTQQPHQQFEENEEVSSEALRSAIVAPSSQHMTPAVILSLQRTLGNQAVQRLLHKGQIHQISGSTLQRVPLTVTLPGHPPQQMETDHLLQQDFDHLTDQGITEWVQALTTARVNAVNAEPDIFAKDRIRQAVERVVAHIRARTWREVAPAFPNALQYDALQTHTFGTHTVGQHCSIRVSPNHPAGGFANAWTTTSDLNYKYGLVHMGQEHKLVAAHMLPERLGGPFQNNNLVALINRENGLIVPGIEGYAHTQVNVNRKCILYTVTYNYNRVVAPPLEDDVAQLVPTGGRVTVTDLKWDKHGDPTNWASYQPTQVIKSYDVPNPISVPKMEHGIRTQGREDTLANAPQGKKSKK